MENARDEKREVAREEKVAKALYTFSENQRTAQLTEYKGYEISPPSTNLWEEASDETKYWFRQQARVALRALER